VCGCVWECVGVYLDVCMWVCIWMCICACEPHLHQFYMCLTVILPVVAVSRLFFKTFVQGCWQT